ncbi:MAG TPA: GNAT family N-acetyltransferase [Bacteroidia bacterium]|nr:GNAT family N-acetyltransferase [Bacteroidia bacterium]
MIVISGTQYYSEGQQKLPFCFLKQYAEFEKETHCDELLIVFSDDKKTLIPLKIHVAKGFKIGQLLHPPLHNNCRLNAMEEKIFLNELVFFIQKYKICDRIVQPANYAIFKAFPDKSIYTAFGTFFLDLENNSEEKLFSKLHSKHRNNIRNADRKGCQVEYGKLQIPVFYQLYQQTMARSAMFCEPYNYFERIYHKMNDSNCICAVVYFKNQPMGALLIPFTNYGAYYLFGASAEIIYITGAINYLHWEVIKKLKSQGVKRYDFVGARLSNISGTKLEGIQKFKARFGAELEKGYFWKLDINKFKCFVFDSLLFLKLKLNRKSLLLDIVDQENKKIHHG